jgi:HAD superfamily hydrolase (TIGR01509 family)
MLEAILFDLDNTLVDYVSYRETTSITAAKAMVKHGLPTSKFDAYSRIFAIFRAKGMEYEGAYHEVVERFDLEPNSATRISQAAIMEHQRVMLEVLHAYPLVKPILAEFKRMGIKRGIVSDAPRDKVWKRLLTVKLEDEFDVVVTHDDTMLYKPNPSPFQLALNVLQVPPAECLFVGDDPSRDIKGAKELGMHTCLAIYGMDGIAGYRRHDPDDRKLADFEIGRFQEILGVVEQIVGKKELKEMLEQRGYSRFWRKARRAGIVIRSATQTSKTALGRIGTTLGRRRLTL